MQTDFDQNRSKIKTHPIVRGHSTIFDLKHDFFFVFLTPGIVDFEKMGAK